MVGSYTHSLKYAHVLPLQPYTDQRVKQRVKELLGSWATEFKSNSRMSPLIKFVEQLGREGVPPQPSPGANRQQPPPQVRDTHF